MSKIIGSDYGNDSKSSFSIGGVMLDSFSGRVADLKPSDRTPDVVLACLRVNPRISVWDMSELAWLRTIIVWLEQQGKVKADMKEPYPWIRYEVIG